MTTRLKSICARMIAVCALVLAMAGNVVAAPTFSYYAGEVWTAKSSWSASIKDTAAGWEYKKVIGTDTLTLIGPGPYELSGDTTDLSVDVEKSCTITLKNYSCSGSKSPIVVEDGAVLTLVIGAGESTLEGDNSYAGINVLPGGKLVIEKEEGYTDTECKLKVNGGNDAAGIGANDESSCGDIEINGGRVSAKGGAEAAGIGGGNINSSGTFTIGSIVINGGRVIADGRDRGSGIGTGLVQKECTVNAAGIYINGGTVTASENDGRGAAIGLGEISSGTVTLNEIVIADGTVQAAPYKGKDTGIVQQEAAGAGIGTGMVETGATGIINRIAISGGTVEASGARRAAGIGTGEAYLGHSSATVGSIEISGGKVTATGGAEAAGIGTGLAHGAAGETTVAVNAITISGGTVVAKKGDLTAGGDIGMTTSTDSGHSTGTATVGPVTVTGGSIVAGTALTNPSNGVKSNLHSITVPGSWTTNEVVTIAGLDDYGVHDVLADADGNIYPFVPDGTYVFNANGRLFEATVNGGDATAAYAADTGMEINGVDIAYGSGEGWFYDGDTLTIDPDAVLTVTGTSRLPVKLVLGDGADVTLDNVAITGAEGIPAVTSVEDSNSTLRLKGANTLAGGAGAAAVQPAVNSTITIDEGEESGVGQLNAIGGTGAAGIGAGATTACGNVVIAGGRVDARGGIESAAGAAGIGAGAGLGADCGTVTITGGTVTATAGYHDAQDVGDGAQGVCAGVVVAGGSLVAKDGKVDPAPTGLDDVDANAVTIHNDDWEEGSSVAIAGLPEGYGTKDICADANKNVCVWLPDGAYPMEVNGEWYVATVEGEAADAVKATIVGKPAVIAAEGLVYTGEPITGVPAGEGYTITDNVETEPGHYTATAVPADGCLWDDHTVAPIEIEWYIAPAIVAPQYGTVTYDDEQDAWVVTLTDDVPGVLELPDDLGNVVVDLNGHDIVGGNGGDDNADGVNGGAAVRITHVDDGTGVNVTFVDGSGTGSSILGGNGADGTKDDPDGGNGGAGIVVDDDAVSPSVTIGEGVEVVGGNGGNGYNSGMDAAGNGGTGGAGVDGDVAENDGTITGGVGGNGGASRGGNGGNGGNGGTGVTGDVGENDGTVTGGGAGNGGNGTTAGNGGNGGAVSGGTVTDATEPNGTTNAGGNGNGGAVIEGLNPAGGADWLDGDQLRTTSIVDDGEFVTITFTVPMEDALDFSDWLERSMANHKLVVKMADTFPGLKAADLAALLKDGPTEGAKALFVSTAPYSETNVEQYSSDAPTKSVTVRVQKPSADAGFFQVIVLD